jgi:hypothetical protein
MLKAFLVAVATLVSFDAVAWQSAIRHELVREASGAISDLALLDWTWG